MFIVLKVLANEDTLLRAHCCRHKCFPFCPRAQHLLRTQILCPGHKNVSDFVKKHFVSATNVSQFAIVKKRHEHQCFRNNVSSFATALILFRNILCPQQMFPSLRSMETQHSFCVPRVCAPKKDHEQQCVRNNVSSFARAFTQAITAILCKT